MLSYQLYLVKLQIAEIDASFCVRNEQLRMWGWGNFASIVSIFIYIPWQGRYAVKRIVLN